MFTGKIEITLVFNFTLEMSRTLELIEHSSTMILKSYVHHAELNKKWAKQLD